MVHGYHGGPARSHLVSLVTCHPLVCGIHPVHEATVAQWHLRPCSVQILLVLSRTAFLSQGPSLHSVLLPPHLLFEETVSVNDPTLFEDLGHCTEQRSSILSTVTQLECVWCPAVCLFSWSPWDHRFRGDENAPHIMS